MTNRIKALRSAAGLTQQELADRINVDKSTVYRYEAGDTDMFQKTAVDIARVLGLKSPEAMLGSAPTQVNLIGEVGAGAQVFPIDTDTEWLDGPPGLDEALAVRVVGRSMLPVYRPGDILFAERRQRIFADVVGLDCIVQVTEGPRLVKRVHAGSGRNVFRLYSYDTQDETEDLSLDWASPIRWVSR